jgi:3-polyprenyl-4-hydroxybenzoate decarboxylase
MAYDDLRALLRALERDGDLRRITAEVDPHLEVAEITDRVNKAGGPALLFENVKGSDLPLAMNVFGTDRRLLKALGLASYAEIGEKIGGLLKPELPQGFVGLREAFGKLGSVSHVPPKKVKSGPVQEIVRKGDEVDLGELPALFTWPEDGGSFFNLGLTHTKDPESGVRNLGLYRLQRHDRRTIGMHWQIHKDSRNHYQVAAQRGERLPVAIAFFIFETGGGKLVGGITLANIRHGVSQSGQIGYWIGEQYAGQGYMVEALGLVSLFAFDTMRLHRIEAACIPDNKRSIRVLEKAGFQREGLLRSYLRINGIWQDHYLYALIADDQLGGRTKG